MLLLQFFDVEPSLRLLKGVLCCTKVGAYLYCHKILFQVEVGSSEHTHVKNTADMLSAYHNMIDLVVSFSIQRQLSSLMKFIVLESSTGDNDISGPGKVDQPQPI